MSIISARHHLSNSLLEALIAVVKFCKDKLAKASLGSKQSRRSRVSGIVDAEEAKLTIKGLEGAILDERILEDEDV